MVARSDLVTDANTLTELHDARLGQAYFSRVLNGLSLERLRGPSALPAWSCAHIVAHVGYNARALARLVDWAETGIENPMYSSPVARREEIEFGATLPDRALRHLHDHAAVQLDVAWRDLPNDRWLHPIRTALGRTVPVSETVWMRTRELWIHAIDLDSDRRIADVPERVSRRLINDVLGAWSSRDDAHGGDRQFVLHATDTGEVFGDTAAANGSVRELDGELRNLMGWATGRSSRGVRARDGHDLGDAPRWI